MTHPSVDSSCPVTDVRCTGKAIRHLLETVFSPISPHCYRNQSHTLHSYETIRICQCSDTREEKAFQDTTTASNSSCPRSEGGSGIDENDTSSFTPMASPVHRTHKGRCFRNTDEILLGACYIHYVHRIHELSWKYLMAYYEESTLSVSTSDRVVQHRAGEVLWELSELFDRCVIRTSGCSFIGSPNPSHLGNFFAYHHHRRHHHHCTTGAGHRGVSSTNQEDADSSGLFSAPESLWCSTCRPPPVEMCLKEDVKTDEDMPGFGTSGLDTAALCPMCSGACLLFLFGFVSYDVPWCGPHVVRSWMGPEDCVPMSNWYALDSKRYDGDLSFSSEHPWVWPQHGSIHAVQPSQDGRASPCLPETAEDTRRCDGAILSSLNSWMVRARNILVPKHAGTLMLPKSRWLTWYVITPMSRTAKANHLSPEHAPQVESPSKPSNETLSRILYPHLHCTLEAVWCLSSSAPRSPTAAGQCLTTTSTLDDEETLSQSCSSAVALWREYVVRYGGHRLCRKILFALVRVAHLLVRLIRSLLTAPSHQKTRDTNTVRWCVDLRLLALCCSGEPSFRTHTLHLVRHVLGMEAEGRPDGKEDIGAWLMSGSSDTRVQFVYDLTGPKRSDGTPEEGSTERETTRKNKKKRGVPIRAQRGRPWKHLYSGCSIGGGETHDSDQANRDVENQKAAINKRHSRRLRVLTALIECMSQTIPLLTKDLMDEAIAGEVEYYHVNRQSSASHREHTDCTQQRNGTAPTESILRSLRGWAHQQKSAAAGGGEEEGLVLSPGDSWEDSTLSESHSSVGYCDLMGCAFCSIM